MGTQLAGFYPSGRHCTEGEHSAGALRRAQRREGGARTSHVAHHHRRQRFAQRGLHCNAPVIVDVDKFEQCADTAHSFTQRLGTECLGIDCCLKRLNSCRAGSRRA